MIAHMLENGDIRNYTIEVHSLKSTSRQIGADDLADLAARLEKAGGENDVEFIVANTDELLNRYHECKKSCSSRCLRRLLTLPRLRRKITARYQNCCPGLRTRSGTNRRPAVS